MADRASRLASTLAPSFLSLLARTRQSSLQRSKALQQRLSLLGLSPGLVQPPQMPLLSPPVAHFPTFQELVMEQVADVPPPANDGLFFQLVRDPRLLYRAYLDDPTMFDDETAMLLQQLMSGQRKLEELKAQEQEILNRATAELAQYSPKPTSRSEQPRPSSSSASYDEEMEDEVPWSNKHDEPTPTSVDLPLELPDAPTFWWKK